MRNTDQIPDYLGGVRLLRVIGTGGYGDVWLGLDGVDSPVAVKVIDRRQIRAEAVSREERAMRLIRDGLSDHPNLVRMRHVGSEGDLFFYSMDLADPQDPDSPAPGNEYRPTTLQSLLAPGVPLPIDECVRICGQILDGLEHLHENGIVHRDLKPANVLLLDGRWQLADFGLATHDQTKMTTVGTVGYIAPNGPLGRSGDLYAVGKILYSMLTGAAVSEYPSISKAYQSSSERVRFGRVLRVINRACHHLPDNRFGIAKELKAALAVAADQKRVARRRGVVWGGLVAGIAVSAYTVGMTFGDVEPLGVGDSIQHITLPALIRETENGPVPIVIDNSGGQRMTARVHRKLTWSAADGGNGHSYVAVLVSPDADQWSVNDARYIATNLGGYLVSLNTREENRWVFENLASDKQLWRDWVSEVVPLMYRVSAPEYFDDLGVRKLFEFSESAQAFYDSHYSVDPADTYKIMLPCSNGPLIGLKWQPRADQVKGQGEFVWDDGQPLEYGSWIPNRNTLDYAELPDPDPAGIVFWDSNLGPRLNREKMYLSAFGFNAEGKNSPAMTWWVQDWSNPPLSEEPNRFISFIVEIPK